MTGICAITINSYVTGICAITINSYVTGICAITINSYVTGICAITINSYVTGICAITINSYVTGICAITINSYVTGICAITIKLSSGLIYRILMSEQIIYIIQIKINSVQTLYSYIYIAICLDIVPGLFQTLLNLCITLILL